MTTEHNRPAFTSQASTPDPGWCGNRSRGAGMGRASTPPEQWDDNSVLYLAKVYISSDGYDAGGAYWGTGEPLWEACPVGSEENHYFFRAASREAARAELCNVNETFTFADIPAFNYPPAEDITDMEIDVTGYLRECHSINVSDAPLPPIDATHCFTDMGLHLTRGNLEAIREYFDNMGLDDMAIAPDAELAGLLTDEIDYQWGELGDPKTMADYVANKESGPGNLGPDDEEKPLEESRWYFYAGE